MAADASTLIRGMFHRPSDKPQPGMGVFPPEWLESTFMPAAVRRVTSTKALQEFSLQYGEPAGDSGLRRSLATKLASINVPAGPEQIVTTVGATHALDIVSRTLLRAGDPVMVEEPGWALEFARLEALGMRILPVPRKADGPDLEVMERYCEAGDGHKPKLFVSVSVLHNPTGYSLTPGSAHRVLQLANKHDFHIVEDDTYSHLAPEHATRLSALDGLQRTIYVSGFAKILAPNWRIGFLAASPALVGRLLETKLLATLTTPSLFERALAWCIDQGQLRRHAERVRLRLDGARGRTVKLALAAGCTLRIGAGGLVRLGRHRRRYRRADAAHARRGLPAGAGLAVPCAAAAQHLDADQLRDRAGCDVLEGVRAGQGAGLRRLRGHQSSLSGASGPNSLSISRRLGAGVGLGGACPARPLPCGRAPDQMPVVRARHARRPRAARSRSCRLRRGESSSLRISSAISVFCSCERRSRFIEPTTSRRPSITSAFECSIERDSPDDVAAATEPKALPQPGLLAAQLVQLDAHREQFLAVPRIADVGHRRIVRGQRVGQHADRARRARAPRRRPASCRARARSRAR